MTPDAGAEALLASPAPEILQVLCHGLRLPEEEGASLLLSPSPASPDGALGVADLMAWPDAEPSVCVLLASCHGGSGTTRVGDGEAGHLGGAFLARGSRVVLLTRASTKVRWSRAMDCSRRVHAGMVAGLPLDEALRAVRQAWVQEHGSKGVVEGAQWMLLGHGGWKPGTPPGPPIRSEQAPKRGWLPWLLATAVLAGLLGLYRKRPRGV